MKEYVITVGIGWVLLASATSGFSHYIQLGLLLLCIGAPVAQHLRTPQLYYRLCTVVMFNHNCLSDIYISPFLPEQCPGHRAAGRCWEGAQGMPLLWSQICHPSCTGAYIHVYDLVFCGD